MSRNALLSGEDPFSKAALSCEEALSGSWPGLLLSESLESELSADILGGSTSKPGGLIEEGFCGEELLNELLPGRLLGETRLVRVLSIE